MLTTALSYHPVNFHVSGIPETWKFSNQSHVLTVKAIGIAPDDSHVLQRFSNQQREA